MEEIIVGRVVPPQETLMSGTYEGNLIWKKDLCRCNQAKIRSYWVRVGPKSNISGVLIGRGKCINRHRKDGHEKTEGEIRVRYLQAKKCPGLPATIRTVSYTHLTLPTTGSLCRSRWSPYH